MTLENDQKLTHSSFGIDRSLLKAKLKLSPTQRVDEHIELMKFIEELRRAKQKKLELEQKDDQL